MVALNHDISSELIKSFEEYIDVSARYLVGMETAKDAHAQTKGQHFHFIADMSEKQYDKFRKTILVNKYKLQGVAKMGMPRQYGKIKKIRDETKLFQYTCKDENIIYKNIDLKTIQEYIAKSYHREERKMPIEELMADLKANVGMFYNEDGSIRFSMIECAIIQFYCDNSEKEKVLTKSSVKSLTIRFLMYYTPKRNIHEIHKYIMLI